MIYDLPKALTVCGGVYEIRSDFREVLDVIEILNNAELKEQERGYLALLFFYPDLQNIPHENYQEALRQCYWFINGGKYDAQTVHKPSRLMDWDQDLPYIIAPVNRVIGHEIRADSYLHWWTFLSAYMEIGDCVFAQIVRVRSLQSKGKPLDKSDSEWYRSHQELVDMKQAYTSEEQELLAQWGVTRI